MRAVFADTGDDGDPSGPARATVKDEEAADTKGRPEEDDFPYQELVELFCAMAILLSIWLLMALIFARTP